MIDNSSSTGPALDHFITRMRVHAAERAAAAAAGNGPKLQVHTTVRLKRTSHVNRRFDARGTAIGTNMVRLTHI